MKKTSVAVKAFFAIIRSKDISLNLRYGKNSTLNFEQGRFAEASDFLSALQQRDNFPDHVLNQYKEVLTDYNYKEEI